MTRARCHSLERKSSTSSGSATRALTSTGTGSLTS
jgi:hypothetical protein